VKCCVTQSWQRGAVGSPGRKVREEWTGTGLSGTVRVMCQCVETVPGGEINTQQHSAEWSQKVKRDRVHRGGKKTEKKDEVGKIKSVMFNLMQEPT